MDGVPVSYERVVPATEHALCGVYESGVGVFRRAHRESALRNEAQPLLEADVGALTQRLERVDAQIRALVQQRWSAAQRVIAGNAAAMAVQVPLMKEALALLPVIAELSKCYLVSGL